MKKTNRGFAIYSSFKDSKGQAIRIQESSAAFGRYAWIFCQGPDGKDAYFHMGEVHSYSPHLTPAQARRVAKALLKFADGE